MRRPRSIGLRSCARTVTVIDASILGPLAVADDPDGRRYRARLGERRLSAPDFAPVEAVSMLRRVVRRGEISVARASRAVADLAALPIVLFPSAPFLNRIWELRDNLTPYDAAYVALAEALDVPLLTADARLAGAGGIRCAVEVL